MVSLDFLFHGIFSAIAAVLIIVLSFLPADDEKKGRRHRILSYIVAVSSLAGLVFILSSRLPIDLSMHGLHNVFGILAFCSSLVVFLMKQERNGKKVKNKWHCFVGYAAAVFAILSIISGIIFAVPLFLTPQVNMAALQCVSKEKLKTDSRCLVAVDNVVYDMSNMRLWSKSGHYQHTCNSEINTTVTPLPATHVYSLKYFGLVVGKIC